MCETLFLMNIICQIVLMEVIIEGKFLSLIFMFLTQKKLTEIFPYVVNCDFTISGASGDERNIVSICQMPLSPAHKGIFLILSAWYQIVFTLTIFFWKLSKNYNFKQFRSMPRPSSDCQTPRYFFILEIFKNNFSPIEFSKLMVYLTENLTYLFCESPVSTANKI